MSEHEIPAKSHKVKSTTRWKQSWNTAKPITKAGFLVSLGGFVISVVLAITTAIYTWIASGQLEQMKGSSAQTDRLLELYGAQLEQLKKQASNTQELSGDTKVLARSASTQAKATMKLADSFQVSVSTSKNALYLDQRSWVGANSVTLNFQAAPLPLKATWEISNFGKTPAIVLDMVTSIHSVRSPIDPIEFMKNPFEKAGSAKFYNPQIFPRQTLTMDALSGPTDQRAVELSKSGALLTYSFLTISYKDTFGKKHITKYCAVWNPEQQGMTACQAPYDFAD